MPKTLRTMRPIKTSHKSAKRTLRQKLLAVRAERVKETISAAEREGFIGTGKEDRISARLSHDLLVQAKERTGIKGTTELLEFALANVALEDRFLETMAKVEGTVDPDIKLGF